MNPRALGPIVAAGIALALVGCSDPDENDRYVCVDRVTQQRLNDDRCGDSGSLAAYWFLLRAGQGYPAVGGSVAPSSGTTATPSKRPAPLPTASGKVATAKPSTKAKAPNLTKPKAGTGSKPKVGSGSSGRVGGGRK